MSRPLVAGITLREESTRAGEGNAAGMHEGVVKVTVLSPQPVVVEGFTAMLGRHADRIEVIDLPTSFDSVEPDVVLYDVLTLHEGDQTGLEALVKETAAVVFAVARRLRPDLLTLALDHGADGFFDLGVSEEELLGAVDSATTDWQAGDEGPDPVVGSDGSEQRSQRLGQDLGLSPRETRVLSLVAQGLTNDEIATRDYLSVNTVKTYIRSAYKKIDVATRTQAGVWAVQHGFGSEPDSSVFVDHG